MMHKSDIPQNLQVAMDFKSKNLTYLASEIQDCAAEPIAFCGAVQSFSFFLAVNLRTLTIEALSKNWSEVLGPTAADYFLGLHWQGLLDLATFEPPKDLSSLCAWAQENSADIKIKDAQAKNLHLSHVYRVQDFLYLEFEEFLKPNEDFALDLIHQSMNCLSSITSIETACQILSEDIRRHSDYDRVMIYRFDAEWNGEVIAEAKVDTLEAFLHLKYPSTDIPPHARTLFAQNIPRIIADTQASAVSILSKSLQLKQIDLSATLGRAVSPFHSQYLEHMGVRASCSFSILVDKKLWGLVACHHYQGPKRPGILMRKGFQIYGDLIASKIIEINKLTQVVAQRNAMEFVHSLLNNLAISHDPQDTFKAKTEQLLALCRGTSALVKLGNQQVFMGQPIQAETLIALHNKLQSSDQFGVWHSHCLKDDLGLKKCDPHAAGALAVPLSCDYKDYVLWLRPEEVQENRWGGALSEPASGSSETKKILSPRQSFAEWQQKVFAQSRPWDYGDIESANFFLSSHVQECLARVQVLASAYKDLERQDKAKDQFISTASHELRTPLAIIQGWVGLLKDDTKHSPLAVKAIDIIERNLKAQSKLIEELLDSFRMKAGKLRISVQDNVDVRDLISKVLDAIRPTLKTQDVTLIWDPQAPVLMSVDPDRLTQIIWNILNNAQKFTPVGGQISVRLQKTDQTVIIEIEDTGIGIDPRFLDEIFECYVQDNTHANKAGGLGIGLSVVRSLTELHGGRVQALSAGFGHGARFKVELPCKNVSTAISASSAAPSNTPTLQNLRILIAEDQPDALLALSMLCERFGGIVTSAKNGAEALELLKSRRFDLILSDLSMPLLDGYELMKFWRLKEQEQKTPKIPAIAISAYTSPSDRVNSLEAGFNAHIGKPIYREELFAVIKSLKLIDLI